MKFLRVLLLGAVAIGIVLGLTSAPSSGSGGAGQATGYGDSVIQPCAPGQDTAPDGGPCLKDLQVESGETAGAQSEGGGGGLSTLGWVGVGVAVLGLGGGAAFAFGRLRP